VRALVAALVILLAPIASGQSLYFSRPDLQAAVHELDAIGLDGQRWNFDALKGRVVLLEFWATWCAPCLQQIPLLRDLRRRHGSERFEIVGISLNSSSHRDLIAWMNRQRVQWPQLHDGRAFSSPVARAFGVEALPASILLDQQGRIVAANLRDAALERAVHALVYGATTSSFDAARIPIVRR
jgi:thiol-disulfide isomerase/thioredoxin